MRKCIFAARLLKDFGPFEQQENAHFVWDFFYLPEDKSRDHIMAFIGTKKYEIIFQPSSIAILYVNNSKEIIIDIGAKKATIEIYGDYSKVYKFKTLDYKLLLKTLKEFDKY